MGHVATNPLQNPGCLTRRNYSNMFDADGMISRAISKQSPDRIFQVVPASDQPDLRGFGLSDEIQGRGIGSYIVLGICKQFLIYMLAQVRSTVRKRQLDRQARSKHTNYRGALLAPSRAPRIR
jgi:hypothetical protein